MVDKKFFTNTYVTGSGRRNYLRIDNLEDPLFTSFTFDIDFISSPLFYTIGGKEYGYPTVGDIGEKIEEALAYMHYNMDDDYNILAHVSANILDGNKLGFGIQQNVYMDMPLYGATEYIYMVDKRNGSASQNDAMYDNNQFHEYGGVPSMANYIKLGDSVKSIVNESDRIWAERQNEQNEQLIKEYSEIIGDESDSDSTKWSQARKDHEANLNEMEEIFKQCSFTIEGDGDYVDENGNSDKGKLYTEQELVDKLNEYKKKVDAFNYLKERIAIWINDELSNYERQAKAAYTGNRCVKEIIDAEDESKIDVDKLKSKYNIDEYYEKFKDDLTDVYRKVETYTFDKSSLYKGDDGESLLIDRKSGDGNTTVRKKHIVAQFKKELEALKLLSDSGEYNGEIEISEDTKEMPEWVYKMESHLKKGGGGADADWNGIIDRLYDAAHLITTYKCDVENSFSDDFETEDIKKDEEMYAYFDSLLSEFRVALYGQDESGNPCTSINPSPSSEFGIYMAAKEKCENDEYSQARKSVAMAQSGINETNRMLTAYNENLDEEKYNEAIESGTQPSMISKKTSLVSSQTVLDMLGFVSGMRKMINDYPYIIQGVTGLDTAYNKHYGITDPYLGSGDDKITLTCLESLDLRVSSMFNRYFNAVYDRQYRRERVPVNLRRFNCFIYVHDIRNFVSRMREGKSYNRMVELTDMYHSAIEFRFYDCEIVPEETGNIFNDISNEAPTEMKKTNFTFKYGNCVVNFVPPSEVAAHNAKS